MARTISVELLADASKMVGSLKDAGKATRSFGDKVQGTGRKMSAFVTVPIVGFLGASTKAALEDDAAQALLKKTLENTTGATRGQVEAVEKQLEAMTKVSTFSDDELRPAFSRLVTSTKNADEASRLLNTAMDIATATGKPLQGVVEALSKAHDGQVGALKRLGIEVKDAEGKTLSFEQIMKNANETFGGQAAAALDTTAGRAKAMKRDFGELQEKIGAQLLPVVEKLTSFFLNTLIPVFDKVSGDNGAIVLLGAAMAGPIIGAVDKLKGAVTGLGAALTFLATHPALLVLSALAVQLPAIIDQIGVFKEEVKDKDFLGSLKALVETPLGGVSPFLKPLTRLLPFHSGGIVPGAPGQNVPIMAQAGERVLPAGGGGGNTYITVNGALDPAAVARQINDLLVRESRRSGSVRFN